MNSAPQAAIGIDIGGTQTKIALVDATGVVLQLTSFPTGDYRTGDSFVQAVVQHLGRLRDHAVGADLAGLGVAAAGFLDAERSRIVFAPNLGPLQDYPLRDRLAAACELPVVLDIDSNAATLAEHRFGAGRGSDRFLCLVLGTGVGAAMVVHGSLLRFAYQGIGDPGHILLMPDGPSCTAGCRGCAEALISASAVQRRAEAVRDSRTAMASIPEIIEAAREGNEDARRVWAETGRWLGLAMASLSPIFAPDRIVVGGGLAEAGPLLLEPAERAFRSSAGAYYHERVTIRGAELGWRAGVIGAACQIWAWRPDQKAS